MSPRLTPMSGELREQAPSLLGRTSASLSRARLRRTNRLREEIRFHPVWGTFSYVGTRLILLLVLFDLSWSLLVVEGARPAMAFYGLTLVALPVGCALALLSESLGPRDEIGNATTSWGSADLNLRVLMGITIILLAVLTVGLGLHSERYGSTSKDPTITCVLPARGYSVPLVGVWRILHGDCAKN